MVSVIVSERLEGTLYNISGMHAGGGGGGGAAFGDSVPHTSVAIDDEQIPAHSIRPGRVSFDERSFNLSTVVAVENLGHFDQLAVHAVEGLDVEEYVTQKDVAKDK